MQPEIQANSIQPRARRKRGKNIAAPISALMHAMCIGFTAIIIIILLLVTGYLLYLGFSSISLAFFTQVPQARGMEGYPGGMLHGLVGTGILLALASLVGIPIGMLTGIFLSEYSADSWLAKPTRFIADVLAGVPSIVVGILGYELLVAPLSFWDGRVPCYAPFGVHLTKWLDWDAGWHQLTLLPNGEHNGIAGAAALAFIMIPIVARTTEEMLKLVPHSYREASIALGASKARTIFKVVVPAATGSLITGIMLALARVAGETAPLLFTALGSRFLSVDPTQPFPSLTAQIFQYATGPYLEERRLAWAGILVLIAMIFVLNLGVRFVARPRVSRS